jgi:hypothetical protein
MVAKNTKMLTFQAGPDLIQALDEVAQQMSKDERYAMARWGSRITRSQAIRILLIEGLARHQPDQQELGL